MTVKVKFECGGCNATADGTDWLRRKFQSFSGRSHGFGGPINVNTIEDITPVGWIAFDPYTYCCYCPKCWAEIGSPPPVSGGEPITELEKGK